MPNTFAEMTPRNLDPMLAGKLSDDARKAVNAAFEAMSAWRTETVKNSEKSSALVIEKTAAAARALGWPEQIVEATRLHLENITKMQVQTMDQMIDAWEGQIKSPTSPSDILSKIKSFSSFGSAGGWSNGDAFQMATLAPLQAYMSFVEQWQKACKDAAASWSQLAQRTSVMQPVALPRGMS
jgi:hypothetical protein